MGFIGNFKKEDVAEIRIEYPVILSTEDKKILEEIYQAYPLSEPHKNWIQTKTKKEILNEK